MKLKLKPITTFVLSIMGATSAIAGTCNCMCLGNGGQYRGEMLHISGVSQNWCIGRSTVIDNKSCITYDTQTGNQFVGNYICTYNPK